ncbi:MAG: integrase, partial [Anaerolineae bacterium]|nr:integrase [Anaerolineae bacterium]
MNWQQLLNVGKHLVVRVEMWLKAGIKPAPDRQIVGVVTDLFRSKQGLITENAFLRQQLIILKRQQTTRPATTQQDRRILVVLASKLHGWKDALHVVKPDTLLKWHRQGFRLFWRWKSKSQIRRPRIAPETITLIKTMAVENRLWGSPRIRDELHKLGIQVSKRTVQKYMRQARRNLPPQRHSQNWSTFLANHAGEIWACDFVHTYDLFFRSVFIFFMIELGSRQVIHYGVTRRPTDPWVTQQLREATPLGERPQYLICDNDGKYGVGFK